jgi:hypothetical protein
VTSALVALEEIRKTIFDQEAFVSKAIVLREFNCSLEVIQAIGVVFFERSICLILERVCIVF